MPNDEDVDAIRYGIRAELWDAGMPLKDFLQTRVKKYRRNVLRTRLGALEQPGARPQLSLPRTNRLRAFAGMSPRSRHHR
jgi:hypothetical protein